MRHAKRRDARAVEEGARGGCGGINCRGGRRNGDGGGGGGGRESGGGGGGGGKTRDKEGADAMRGEQRHSGGIFRESDWVWSHPRCGVEERQGDKSDKHHLQCLFEPQLSPMRLNEY